MRYRSRLALWSPSARKFRTRILRYLQARVDALEGITGEYVNGRLSATRSIRDAVERMR